MRTWTLPEANAALPRVRAIVEEGRRVLEAVRDVDANLEDLRIIHGEGLDDPACPGHAEQVEYLRQRGELMDAMTTVTLRVQAVGCEVKDFTEGLVDFLGQIGGTPVYLCWRHGEPTVRHWHTLEGGFAARKPIPGATP